MKQKLLSAVLAAAMFCTAAIPAVSASEERSLQNVQTVSDAPLAQAALDETSVYNAMIALKDEYPNGMEWTNDDFYAWNGGYYSGGYGCAAFAFILSDAAFGNLPVRRYTSFDASSVRVGDILRNYGHSYIVLEVHEDYFTIAEGNINESILWGREIGFDGVADGFEEHLTRYPEEETPTETTTAATETSTTTTETTTTTTTETVTEPVSYEVFFGLDITPPDKEFYSIGEPLDLSGVTAEVWYIAYYMDGETLVPCEEDRYAVSLDELEITGFSSDAAGTCRVTLAYETELPYIGRARMENGFLVNIMEETAASTETTETTVHTENGPSTTETTTETTQGILDADFSVSVEVVTLPTKTTYTVGDKLLTTAGLGVNTWISEFGTWIPQHENVNPSYYRDEFTIWGFDTSEAGECVIKVQYSVYNSILDIWVSDYDTFTITVVEDDSDPSEPVTTYPTWGNIDGDEKIDATDAAAILIAAAAVGSGNPSGLTSVQEDYADVDGSGDFDATDAALVLRYAAYTGSGGTMTLPEYLESIE